MEPRKLKAFMRAGYRKPTELTTRPNGELSCRDYLGEGIIIKYSVYPTNHKCTIEVVGRTASLGKIEYNKEYESLIERGGIPISETQLRQMLAWRDSFYSMVDYQCPDERPVLTRLFETLEKRLEQLKAVREATRKSGKFTIQKPKRTSKKKKRGK